MNVIRIVNELKIASRFSTGAIARFSSYTLTNSRFCYVSNEDDSGRRSKSAVYQRKLKFQRPTTIPWKPQLQNSVHFIGSVDRSPMLVNTRDGRLLVRALLRVTEPSDPKPKQFFRIETLMFGKIAASCVRYLKADDYIHVSGKLKVYPKADEDGNLSLCYQVNVGELNYVIEPGKKKSEQQQLEEDEARRQKYTNGLHLWQVFFASPEEWWDNRKDKRSSRKPDFKHKDTGEVLWVSHNDPPWVKRQLELIDTKLGRSFDEYSHSSPGFSKWVYDV